MGALKILVLYLFKRYGWIVAAKVFGEALVRDIVVFNLKAQNEEQKAVFETIAKITKDGWVDRGEIVSLLRAFKPVIPGWVDDLVIEAACMLLLAGNDFRYGTDDRPELFEAFSVALEDGIFSNRELGTILIDTI